MKFPEENMGKKLLYMDLSNDFFLDMTSKAQTTKHKKYISYKKLLFKIHKELK